MIAEIGFNSNFLNGDQQSMAFDLILSHFK